MQRYKRKQSLTGIFTDIEIALCFIIHYIHHTGTSPHAVSSVSVVPGTDRADVSWEPGFDGGFVQKFTVWSVSGVLVLPFHAGSLSSGNL